MTPSKTPDEIIEKLREEYKILANNELFWRAIFREGLKQGIQIGRNEMRKEIIDFIFNTIEAVPELDSVIWRDKIKELQSKGDKK